MDKDDIQLEAASDDFIAGQKSILNILNDLISESLKDVDNTVDKEVPEIARKAIIIGVKSSYEGMQKLIKRMLDKLEEANK